MTNSFSIIGLHGSLGILNREARGLAVCTSGNLALIIFPNIQFIKSH